MDSYSLLPSHNIKLEPASQADHVYSWAKEMTTEMKVFDVVDSKLSVSIKTEQPEVDVEHPDQDNRSMDSYSLLPSQNIKLEPASQAYHVNIWAKEMNTEMKVFDVVDSKLSVSNKIEQPEVDVEHPDQDNRSMDPYSLLPSHNIKLETASQADHVNSWAKEMTTEMKVFDVVDSKQSVSIKTEQPEVDVEHPDQDNRSMDSYSLLPSDNIKLEPVSEADHVNSWAKEMTTEMKVFDVVDSKQSVSIKTEQPEVDVEHPDQDNKTLTCSQNVHSLSTQEHSQMEKSMYGNMDFKFVKQDISDVLCEDRHQKFGEMAADMTDGSSDHEITGDSRRESKMTQNFCEGKQEHSKCSQISDSVSSLYGINSEISLTDQDCQFQNNMEAKAGDKPAVNIDGYFFRHKKKYAIEKLFKCDFCSASFTSAGDMKNHRRKHTGEKPYKCDDCGVSFTVAGRLQKHRRTHTGDKRYQCEDCGLSLANVSSLRKHKRIHTEDRHYKCDDCGAYFILASSLKFHKRLHTVEKPFKCDDCGVSFIDVGSLWKHKKTHTEERPYKCDDCGAYFKLAISLKVHKRLHTVEKPYKCDDCGASFFSAGDMKKHRSIYTGERPYKCDDCDAYFTRASSLKSHKRTHTGEGPYKCNYCGAPFAHAGTLQKHERLHTGERPYKCDDCDESFTEVSWLNEHRRTHMGE